MTSEKINYDFLIIEDDLATIRLITIYFERKGYKCKSVTRGNKSLKELKRARPKVILLDVTLPDLEWYDVAEQIKANSSLKNIPLFLFGETTEPNMTVKIKQLGIDGIIPKPFCLADFDVIIKFALKPVIDNIILWNYDDNENIK